MEALIQSLSVKEFIEWDRVNWSSAIRCWNKYLDRELQDVVGLELGSHNGGLSFWLASKGAKVVCSDVETLPEKFYKRRSDLGLEDVIEDKIINALEISYQDHFDLIVFKSIVGGIGRNEQKENQELLFHQIYKALKPGGLLLFAENLRASYLHQMARNHFVKWGQSWRYVTLGEIKEFLFEYELLSLETHGFLGAFGFSEAQRNFLGYIDRFFLDPVLPSSWKYISVGVARKPIEKSL